MLWLRKQAKLTFSHNLPYEIPKTISGQDRKYKINNAVFYRVISTSEAQILYRKID